jgi:hypothetical protein
VRPSAAERGRIVDALFAADRDPRKFRSRWHEQR